jgi:HD domain
VYGCRRWLGLNTAKGLARGRGPLRKAAAVGSFLARCASVVPTVFRGRCEVAVRCAVRLSLGPRVVQALDHAYERFDGKGMPRGLRGEEISRVSRLIALAELATFFLPAGVETACEVIEARANGQFDPKLTRAFVAHARELQSVVAAPSLWQRVLDAEPRPHSHTCGSRWPACKHSPRYSRTT